MITPLRARQLARDYLRTMRYKARPTRMISSGSQPGTQPGQSPCPPPRPWPVPPVGRPFVAGQSEPWGDWWV